VRGDFADALAGVIACANDRLARSVVVKRAWSLVTDPKEVRNDSDSIRKPWPKSSVKSSEL